MGMKKSISEGQNFGIKTSSVKNFLEANKVKVQSTKLQKYPVYNKHMTQPTILKDKIYDDHVKLKKKIV